MRCAAAISEHPLATHAVGEVVGQVLEQLGGRPDIALLFVAAPFGGAFEDIVAAVRATLAPGALVGTTTAGVVGAGREVEAGAAISLFAAELDAPARTVRLGTRTVAGELEVVTDAALDGAAGTLVLLADPTTFPVEPYLEELARQAPALTVVGGLASGGGGLGGTRLAADGHLGGGGAVGLLLDPAIGATALVSQGCDPVGDPLVVTRATGPLVEEIAGRPALDVLLGLAAEATPAERARLARGMALGIALDERKVDLERSDFLVRAILGGDKRRRAIAVGTEVEVGTTVQFQARDATSADADLRDLLVDAPGRAALVFTCTGRGAALFGEPHHDAEIVHEHVDGGAVAGMACAGEIGPVGGRARLHAMSASLLLLDRR